MAKLVPPVPYKEQVINESGLLSNAWAIWFRDMFSRIGGTVALSNLEIATQLQSFATLQANVTTLQAQVATLQSNINDLNQGPKL